MTVFSKLITTAAMAAIFAFAAPADAQGKRASGSKAKGSAKSPKAKSTKAKSSKLPKTKDYDFLADDIEGERVLPNTDRILGVVSTKHSSLIRLREHFLDQIIRSAEML